MKKVYLFVCGIFTFLCLDLNAQRLEKFSENHGEFITQLAAYMTASKRKVMEETYKEFETVFKSGMFNNDEITQILKTGNAMLDQRMTASPYFSDYLTALIAVKKIANGPTRFLEWHAVLDNMLADIENRRLKPFQDYLRFSIVFFEEGAIRSSKSGGTSWFAHYDEFRMDYEEKVPVITFDKLDLMASRRQDSIFIRETSGKYYPVEKVWRGEGGKVSWERLGLDPSVYAVLGPYQFDPKQSLYEVKSAQMHYPTFFGNQMIEGSFSDKLVASADALEGSYPRFESRDQFLKVDNIGKGIKYQGGFRLHGTTIYGFGTKNDKAKIKIYNKKEELVFRGDAELFTIHKEEKIAGDRVDGTLYFGLDSIYHPSINVRFKIPTKEMQLSRGQRGSDRNPFFNSLHQVNIQAENIHAYIDQDSVIIGKKTIAIAKKRDVNFESLEYFKESDYQRIQNIATSNPIAIMKVTAEREGTNFIDANLLAERINSRFTVENITSLLYDLVAQGFINYDSEEQLVEVKDKVFHYADADQKKVDYDGLKIRSKTDNTNAVLNLKTNQIAINGVEHIEFSPLQRVALVPVEEQVILKGNRNLDFDGKLFAGFSTIEGKEFHFDYDNFQINLDSVRYFDLFAQTGMKDKNQKPIAESIASRIEHLNGVLLIDAPSNKSGVEDIEMFPSLQSKDNSYVFYDYDGTQGGAYQRDSFYFKLEPFSFNRLDKYMPEDIQFKGTLVSADIFPDFKETIVLQEEDQSLGFQTKSPEDGYPNYTGKGNYKGDITLTNKGLTGNGELKYLGASVNSEDIVFKPKQMTGTADRFDLEEDRVSEVEVPQVRGVDVSIDWRPYKDSMYVSSEEAPFDLFKEDNHTVKGTLILTPGGLKGDGLLDWDKASMFSNLFSFGAFSAQADTTNIKVKAVGTADEIALSTSNVKGVVDFDDQIGNFTANDEFLVTTLPYNQFSTSMNEFTWDMKEETIEFKSLEEKLGNFVSIHPDQDSLHFDGQTAFYDLKTNELRIGGVPHIISADAFVYPDSGFVEIQPGGILSTLENARIVADTLNQYHVINRATVQIQGRRLYRAKGFYEYNIGDKEQEIDFQDIVGQPVGKGSWKKKKVVTRATGKVTADKEFYIDQKTIFQGEISLNAESKNLQFDGFARLEADKLPKKYWFTVSSEGDKNDLAIQYDKPKSLDGDPLRTGLFLSKENARIYPRVMMPLYFRKDRAILPTKGVFKYNKEKDYFVFGDSAKVITNTPRGNKLIFNNNDGTIEAEGKFNIGSGLKYISVDATGIAKTEFPPAPPPEPETDPDIMLDVDTMVVEQPAFKEKPLTAEFMAGINLIIPERLLKIIITDFKSASFDARNITYLTDIDFYKKAASEMFPDDKDVNEAINAINTGFLDIPKKFNEYTFLFSKLKMKWDPDYQSFVTTEKTSGLNSIATESIQKMITCHVEFKMPSNEDDRLYIYMKSPSELFYFFGYKQGIMNITSNNPRFMDEVIALKAKEKILKMDDGETYEIQEVEPGDANRFVRRIQAANNK